MIIKEYDSKLPGDNTKVYFEENFDMVRFLIRIRDSGINIRNVIVDEDVERDMQSVSGRYNIQTVIDNYDYIKRNCYSEFSLSLIISGEVNGKKFTIIPKESGHIEYIPRDKNSELTDIIK